MTKPLVLQEFFQSIPSWWLNQNQALKVCLMPSHAEQSPGFVFSVFSSQKNWVAVVRAQPSICSRAGFGVFKHFQCQLLLLSVVQAVPRRAVRAGLSCSPWQGKLGSVVSAAPLCFEKMKIKLAGAHQSWESCAQPRCLWSAQGPISPCLSS